MREGLGVALALRQELLERGPAQAAAIRPWLELGFLCDTAELSLASALFRTESRGAHFREDFPITDDAAWKGSVFADSWDGVLDLSYAGLPEGRPCRMIPSFAPSRSGGRRC